MLRLMLPGAVAAVQNRVVQGRKCRQHGTLRRQMPQETADAGFGIGHVRAGEFQLVTADHLGERVVREFERVTAGRPGGGR